MPGFIVAMERSAGNRQNFGSLISLCFHLYNGYIFVSTRLNHRVQGSVFRHLWFVCCRDGISR